RARSREPSPLRGRRWREAPDEGGHQSATRLQYVTCHRLAIPHMAKRYLRTAKMNTRAGSTSAAPPANFRCRGETLRLCTRKAVSVRFSIVNTAAANTSFQEMVKANTAEATRPGSTSGSTTLRKACQRLQPSVHAASSSSIGMPEKIEKVMSTAKGMASTV